MDQFTLQRIVGWSALINTFIGAGSFTALILFFALGGLWGPINDGLSVVWALSLIPLAGWFFLGNRAVYPLLSTGTAVLGMAAMLIFAVLQFLLVVGMVQYEQTLSAILTLTGLIGLWQILNGLMALRGGMIPIGLVWVMLFSGVGLLLSGVGFWMGGAEHPVTATGFIVGFIAGCVWAFWLARLLFASQHLALQ